MTSEEPTPNSTPAQPSQSPEPSASDDRADSSSAYREVTVRRAPKFVPFMAVGAILGFLAALVIAYTGPVDPTLTRESVLGFFTVALALPGVLLAALLVLLIDRRSVKRAERARAQRLNDDA